MKTPINRFLGSCVICLLLGCSSSMTDAQYVEKALGYLDHGELQAAKIELKNALQQNQKNALARKLLGEVHLEYGDAASAEKELKRASELGVTDDAVLPLLARAFLLQGKHDELHALSLEKLMGKEQKSDVLATQGLGKLAQGKTDWAAAKIDRALLLDPQSTHAGVARARLLAKKEKYDLAQKGVDRVLEMDGGYAPAWSLQGDLESRDNNLAKAEAAYTKAIENSADDFYNLLKRGEVRIKQAKYGAAQKDIDVLKERAPQYADVNYAQGLIHFRNNRLSEAQDSFNLALQANKRHLWAVYFLSLTHLQLGNSLQAEEYGNRFLSAVPGSIRGRKLMAAIELQNKRYASAEELIRPVVDYRKDDVAAINLLANSLLKQNKTDEAIKLLETVASLQPESAIAQVRLGAALLVGKRLVEGVRHVEKALKMDPKLPQVYPLLVSGYLKNKDFNKALEAANSYRDSHPDSVAPYNLIGRLKQVSGQEVDAIKAFTSSREILEGDPTANHALAALAIKKKDYPQARKYYKDVLAHHENHLTTLLKLVVLDDLEEKPQVILKHLQQAATAHPQAILPNVMLARYHLTKGNPTKVQTLLLQLNDRQKRTPAVLEVMAISYLAQKQFHEAKHALDLLVEQQPDSAQAHFLLAQVHAGLGSRSAIGGELETAIELAPKYFAARLAYANLLLLEGQKGKLSDQLVVLNEISPEHPDVLRLSASLAQVEGDQETASDLLEDLFEKSPTTASMLSVARQKWIMGDKMEALELQEQWMEKHPEDLVAGLALAGAYSQQDKIERAIAKYKQILEKEKQNVTALNDLAWHLRNKQPAKALEYAERAKKLAPESAIVMDTLAVVLLKNGDLERAKRNIERALAKKPNRPDFRYHNAMIDAAAGDKVLAIKALQLLLGEDGNFPGRVEVQQLLIELQAEAAKATPQAITD